MEHLRTYRDAVAVITGGALGIGAALAQALVNQDASVVIADRDGRSAAELHAIIVEPMRWRVAWLLDRVSPRLSDWYVGKHWARRHVSAAPTA
jgi:NAD(P)-dependent dehydrogenase (short-subunit alcohol dehydrogenase family)